MNQHMHKRYKWHEHSANPLLHNVQQTGYNGFRWPLPNPILQNTTKDKAYPCCPLALSTSSQMSFQPWSNCRPTSCRSCYKRALGAQNGLVTLRPPMTTVCNPSQKAPSLKFGSPLFTVCWLLDPLFLNHILYLYELVLDPTVASIH